MDYRDKNGTIIELGATLIHDDGGTVKIQRCHYDIDDMGFYQRSAETKKMEFESLQFYDLREWEIVE